MSANLSATFYLISGILFILALRGLSSPETSRQGNYFGIAGMAIAIIVTFLSVGNLGSGFIYVLIFLVIGGSIGAFIAFKIPMTAMPELVAGFHSLVGLAVFVAISAFLNPEAFNLGSIGNIKLASLIEMSLGAAIGAITFSGSIIAFLKLRGIMSGAPITFKGQHFINLFIGLAIIFFNLLFKQHTIIKYFLDNYSYFFFSRNFAYYSNWRSRYASSNFNAKFLLRLGCSWNWIYIGKYGFNYYRSFSRIFWSNTFIYNVQRNE